MKTLCLAGKLCPPPTGLHRSLPIQLPQFLLRLLEYPLAGVREVSAGPIDVEVEHGHGRGKRLCLAAKTRLGGSPQRSRDLLGIVPGKDPLFQR